jgi:hypothetical protein
MIVDTVVRVWRLFCTIERLEGCLAPQGQ